MAKTTVKREIEKPSKFLEPLVGKIETFDEVFGKDPEFSPKEKGILKALLGLPMTLKDLAALYDSTDSAMNRAEKKAMIMTFCAAFEKGISDKKQLVTSVKGTAEELISMVTRMNKVVLEIKERFPKAAAVIEEELADIVTVK